MAFRVHVAGAPRRAEGRPLALTDGNKRPGQTRGTAEFSADGTLSQGMRKLPMQEKAPRPPIPLFVDGGLAQV